MEKMTADDWRTAMGLRPGEDPELLVLEGTWWERDAYARRLVHLDGARELDCPGLHSGRFRDRPVVYGCAYGAARAVEPVHLLAQVARPLVVQIGSCGGLQPGVATGDVVVPGPVTIGEGASAYYGFGGEVEADPGLATAMADEWRRRGFTVHQGRHVTSEVLLRQPPELVEAWRAGGHLAVDMETSAVLSAARWAGLRAAACLWVWDELLRGRSWLDPFEEHERAAQQAANDALFDVALSVLAT
ncbi:MAG: phosphorylase family protein [Acidimicrobiia bacterium]